MDSSGLYPEAGRLFPSQKGRFSDIRLCPIAEPVAPLCGSSRAWASGLGAPGGWRRGRKGASGDGMRENSRRVLDKRTEPPKLYLTPMRHLSALLAPVEPGQTFTGRVVEVVDGDTYDVRRSIGGKATIRLYGTDAPEFSQRYGTAATRAARRYVGGENASGGGGCRPLWTCCGLCTGPGRRSWGYADSERIGVALRTIRSRRHRVFSPGAAGSKHESRPVVTAESDASLGVERPKFWRNEHRGPRLLGLLNPRSRPVVLRAPPAR